LHALRHTDGLNRVQTLFANGETRNVAEGNAAETAIRGEEDGKDASNYGQDWRDERNTLLGALDSSLSA
jgi:hypothetical protein